MYSRGLKAHYIIVTTGQATSKIVMLCHASSLREVSDTMDQFSPLTPVSCTFFLLHC